MNKKLLYLQNKALNIRIDSIRATTASKSGHPTSALSAADIIAVLFFHTMQYDPKNPKASNNDRFILSKGHAIPVVYAALKQAEIISDEELLSLRKFDSVLEGHPTPRFKYNEAATGSLGQGLSIGVGEAINAKLDNLTYKTYVMIGDGESAEGSIWEAAELAAHRKLNNLVGILDCNRLGQSEPALHAHDVEKYRNKFEAFGWHTIIINGHDIEQIINAFEEAKTANKPVMVVAKTFKGYGLADRSDKNNFHGKTLTEEEMTQAIENLKLTFKEASNYSGDTSFYPKLPPNTTQTQPHSKITLELSKDPNSSLFEKGNKLATRKAYGYGITALGRKSKKIITLDGDVKNSTFSSIFEKEFPERFIQCFIAEQNMISVATGLELRQKIPFVATFAAFFTRAFDQIRMAGIGRNALRLCGSHCGVSIGEDGPSQMGLEDIAIMRTVPNSIVFYPSDAVSAYKLIEQMANYHDGISYLRTTRSSTEILYDKEEEFTIGGCKILKQSNNDKACIVAAGITLHESLKASKELEKENINVSIIDLYCIKPLNRNTVLTTARNSCNKILTVEDHYQAGGIGEAVSSALVNENLTIESLCVREISRSGTPQKLLAYAKIDCANIISTIKKLL